VAQNIAGKPFDRALEFNVQALAQLVSVQNQRVVFNLPQPARELLRADDSDLVYYQVLGPHNEFLSGERDLPHPPDDEVPQVGDVRLRNDEMRGLDVRIAYTRVKVDVAGEPCLVQVAETREKRSVLATEIIKGVMLPQFVILPLAVLLVWLALARGIAPLSELQQRIRWRESTDLSPIDERDAPEEVAPLVRAINDLLARLDQSISTQKHFLADAAHQLKTPLAGLRTQAELAQRQIDAGQHDPQALKKTLQQIARSSQSAAHMVNQLLAMARAENQQQVAQRQLVNLARLATETVRDFVPRALEKRIDLGYEGPESLSSPHAGTAGAPSHPQGPQVLGHALLLRELIRNLVDNALQYTPAGGTVTVRVLDDPFGQVVVLQVEDSGPGIPPAERELVFQPFYRSLGTDVDGSGLGLAIVREIAMQHGAEIAITDASSRTPPGTLITVRLPASSSTPADPAAADGPARAPLSTPALGAPPA
jgi:two-component system sensor histidine kinase TctE